MVNNIEKTKALTSLKDKDKYKKFDKDYFVHVPELEGYLYKINKQNYIIINTNTNYEYPKQVVSFNGFNFIFYNSSNIDSFINNVDEKIDTIMSFLDNFNEEHEDKSIPFGYVKDDNGDIKVNLEEAKIVRTIYREYPNTRSIRKVAKSIKKDYSFVREILSDTRYKDIRPSIIPQRDVDRVEQLKQANRKNKYNKKVDNRLKHIETISTQKQDKVEDNNGNR